MIEIILRVVGWLVGRPGLKKETEQIIRLCKMEPTDEKSYKQLQMKRNNFYIYKRTKDRKAEKQKKKNRRKKFFF